MNIYFNPSCPFTDLMFSLCNSISKATDENLEYGAQIKATKQYDITIFYDRGVLTTTSISKSG